VARRRAWWRKYLTRIDITRMVFVDETWTKTNMAPLRGWGTKGKRLIGRAPHGHWKTLTFLAALRAGGVTAPWLLDGPINSESFLIYVREVLVPTLRRGNIVVMDNLGSHKAKAIRQAITRTGARLVFLPPYSPDLNPIEQFFAKLKNSLRKAKERSINALNDRIGEILKATSEQECSNYITNAGYGSI
jgi:transposase